MTTFCSSIGDRTDRVNLEVDVSIAHVVGKQDFVMRPI